jgi:hypothetical protein
LRVRALDQNGDMQFGRGQQEFLIDSTQAVAQCIKTRFGLWQGQWFLNTNEGTPWLTMILGKTSKAVRTYAIQQRILGTPYVTGISDYVDSLQPDRQLTVSCTVMTAFSKLTLSLSLNSLSSQFSLTIT